MPDYSLKLYQVSIMALPFLLAVTMREALRGYVAHKLGDPTVKSSGRLSANPLVHADPIWTGVVPVVAFVVLNLPILFGQAKPMPIDPRHFRNIRRDLLVLAVSGPASLFLLAIFWAYIVRFSAAYGLTQDTWFIQTGIAGIYLSSIFCVIGLLPIPPLDGGKILEHFLPPAAGDAFRTVEPYGFFIIIALFIFAPAIIVVPSEFLFGLVVSMVGI